MSELDGQRVLVVEDEAIVAAMVVDVLEDLGANVVGPAGNVAMAARLAAVAEVDLALLDLNLRGEAVYPVADVLARRSVPFAFASGYARPLPEWRHVPLLAKPYTAAALVALLVFAYRNRTGATPDMRPTPPLPSAAQRTDT